MHARRTDSCAAQYPPTKEPGNYLTIGSINILNLWSRPKCGRYTASSDLPGFAAGLNLHLIKEINIFFFLVCINYKK
jgi:hypothetical protein